MGIDEVRISPDFRESMENAEVSFRNTTLVIVSSREIEDNVQITKTRFHFGWIRFRAPTIYVYLKMRPLLSRILFGL